MVRAALLMCLLILFLSTLPAGGEEKLAPPDLPAPAAKPYGSTTYALTVRDLEGNEVKLSAFKGKTVFLHYWATYCGACVSELPSLERLRESLRDRTDIAFLLVSKDDDAGMVGAFLQKRGLDLPGYMRKETLQGAPGWNLIL